MSKPQDRMIYQRQDGLWVNKRNDASKASSIHSTQKEAMSKARQHLINQGGGELTVKGTNQLIRQKDTIGKGNDPCPPKG